MELVHSHSSLKASLGFIRWGQRHRLADSWVWIPTWSLPIWTTLHKNCGPHEPDSLSSNKMKVVITAFLTDLGEGKIKEVKVLACDRCLVNVPGFLEDYGF